MARHAPGCDEVTLSKYPVFVFKQQLLTRVTLMLSFCPCYYHLSIRMALLVVMLATLQHSRGILSQGEDERPCYSVKIPNSHAVAVTDNTAKTAHYR